MPVTSSTSPIAVPAREAVEALKTLGVHGLTLHRLEVLARDGLVRFTRRGCSRVFFVDMLVEDLAALERRKAQGTPAAEPLLTVHL